jgi:vacuolar-type H+-ATPase subunit F/Vma7
MMRNKAMKVFAIGNRDILTGFMLGGIKERLETNESNDALKYLRELAEKESACMVIISSEIFNAIRNEIDELQDRKRGFIIYEFSGGGLKWRGKK